MAELDRARLTTRLDLARLGEVEVREMAQDLLGGSPNRSDRHGAGVDPATLADLADSLRDILRLRYWNLTACL